MAIITVKVRADEMATRGIRITKDKVVLPGSLFWAYLANCRGKKQERMNPMLAVVPSLADFPFDLLGSGLLPRLHLYTPPSSLLTSHSVFPQQINDS